MSVNVLLCVGKDPWGEPQGGGTNFAKQMLYTFGDRLAVASSTEENLPLRKWCYRSFYGKNIKFFNMGIISDKKGRKAIIPRRYTVYRNAKLSMAQIYALGVRNLFIQAPELLFAAVNYKWDSVCYRFAGVNNPIRNSRYRWARWFGELYEKKMFHDLKKINTNVLLASAENKEIDKMLMRSGGIIDRCLLVHFPTRVDTDKFKPISKKKARAMLHIENDKLTIVTCGRISWIKGWDLILNAVDNLRKRCIDCRLIFVGDGEDRDKVVKKAQRLGITKSIQITGFIPNNKVGIYLNAADLCVVGSHREGWSLAMLEVLACGKPLVSTEVSGAKDMISHGENGFIVKERNPRLFADAILKTLELKRAKEVSLKIAARYSTNTLETDFSKIWDPLSTSGVMNSEIEILSKIH
jgi:glycosyltransferase involved in cell wall biosynthesis